MGAKINPKEINNGFRAEFKVFIERYLLKLFGYIDKQVDVEMVALSEDRGFVEKEGNTVYFSVSGWRMFKFNVAGSRGFTEDNIKLANRIVQAYLPLSEYKRTGSMRQNEAYPDKVYEPNAYAVYVDAVYKRAIEQGICFWIVEHAQNDQIQLLMSRLEEWSVKTYEGRKVTLGFIINPEAESDFDSTYGSWLDFVQKDAVAVLTDCIHSVIELDSQCNFARYISISDGNKFLDCDLSYQIPLRFTQVIRQNVTGRKVGVFLLSNGDIVLAKNEATCFVKRNYNWLNLSYDAFYNVLMDFIQQYNISSTDLIENIFASVLDVSFSHTGGIIAIVDEPWKNNQRTTIEQSNILSPCDNLLSPTEDAELMKAIHDPESKQQLGLSGDISAEDMKKRLHKKNVIRKLTDGKKFQEMDRKLRAELMAMDGACILDREGKIYSFGAIIQYESGSSGGGRSAAAKKLSEYGMAVKISTDGYIEVYVNKRMVHAIK